MRKQDNKRGEAAGENINLFSRNPTAEEMKKLWSFFVETFEFTEEQTEAIDHQRPMTQELFDSILDRCSEVGHEADSLFYKILDEYPDFVAVRAEKIVGETSNAEIQECTQEQLDSMRKKLFAKIRTKYGEDAI